MNTLGSPNIDAPFGYGEAHDEADGRLTAPPALRNAAYIEAELRRIAPACGRVLELASGTGEHAIRFAPALPDLEWQPTDVDPARLVSISAWKSHAPAPNLCAPRPLDATVQGWAAEEDPVDMVVLINLLHLLPTSKAETLLREMPQVLVPGGRAVIYGPFLRDGQATSDGDAAFDAKIRAADPEAGYKDVAWVVERMHDAGATHVEAVEMPANNLLLVFAR